MSTNNVNLNSIGFLKAGRINELVNNKFSSIIDFCSKYSLLRKESGKHRPGLISVNPLFSRKIGLKNESNEKKIISTYTSGEDTENESDQSPGIKDVIEHLWDSNTIQQVVMNWFKSGFYL